MAELLQILESLEREGVSLEGWLLAWARLLPTVALVPAFGARFLPPAARAVFGLSLAFTLAPAMPSVAPGQFLAWAFLVEALSGLPLALSVTALFWAAMMAGGLMDDLRGNSVNTQSAFAGATTPLSTLLALFAAVAFLKLGGATRLVEALAVPPEGHSLLVVISALVGSIEVALALSAPMLVTVVVWEVAGALIARSASPAHIQVLLAPLRSLVVLGALAISADALFQLLSRLMARQL